MGVIESIIQSAQADAVPPTVRLYITVVGNGILRLITKEGVST